LRFLFLQRQLAARTLLRFVHDETTDAASVGQSKPLTYWHDDEHESLFTIAVKILAQIEVAELPAAGVRRVAQVALQDMGADLAGDVGQLLSVGGIDVITIYPQVRNSPPLKHLPLSHPREGRPSLRRYA
jgi:hypothetical protein